MSKAVFITVRSNSTRLPNKAYRKIKNQYTIEYVIDQVKKSSLSDLIVLCTTELPADDKLCEIAINNNIKFFRGNEVDKLERWNGACDKYDVDFCIDSIRKNIKDYNKDLETSGVHKDLSQFPIYEKANR